MKTFGKKPHIYNREVLLRKCFFKDYKKASRFQCCAKFHHNRTNMCRVGNWEIP